MGAAARERSNRRGRGRADLGVPSKGDVRPSILRTRSVRSVTEQLPKVTILRYRASQESGATHPIVDGTRSLRHDRRVNRCQSPGGLPMMSRIPFPVIDTHDIRKGHAPLITTGTAGEITGISGATPIALHRRVPPVRTGRCRDHPRLSDQNRPARRLSAPETGRR
jgi:hypothetical protein